MDKSFDVFKYFATWDVVEQFCHEFIMLIGHDNNAYYLPSNELFDEKRELDEDGYVLVESYKESPTKARLICDGACFTHPVEIENSEAVKNPDLVFWLDRSTLDRYIEVEPTIQRMVNRCKLKNNDIVLSFGKLTDSLDISQYQLLRSYMVNAHHDGNYLIVDYELVKRLCEIKIDNKAIMYLMNIIKIVLEYNQSV